MIHFHGEDFSQSDTTDPFPSKINAILGIQLLQTTWLTIVIFPMIIVLKDERTFVGGLHEKRDRLIIFFSEINMSFTRRNFNISYAVPLISLVLKYSIVFQWLKHLFVSWLMLGRNDPDFSLLHI